MRWEWIAAVILAFALIWGIRKRFLRKSVQSERPSAHERMSRFRGACREMADFGEAEFSKVSGRLSSDHQLRAKVLIRFISALLPSSAWLTLMSSGRLAEDISRLGPSDKVEALTFAIEFAAPQGIAIDAIEGWREIAADANRIAREFVKFALSPDQGPIEALQDPGIAVRAIHPLVSEALDLLGAHQSASESMARLIVGEGLKRYSECLRLLIRSK